MPRLIVKQKAEVINELILKGSQVSFKIGSEPDNDLVIDDKKVSMLHAKIERHANTYHLEDLKSAFGTFLNSEKVDGKVELKNGDEISLGAYTIVFDNPLEYLDMPLGGGKSEEFAPKGAREQAGPAKEPVAHATSEEDDEVFVEVLDHDEQEQNGQHEPVSQPELKTEMAPYYLLAIYGPYRGKRYQLRYSETKIGRDVKLNDVVIRQNKKGEVDPSISRRHATISYQNSSFYVGDKRSKTRTYVNQAMVPEDAEVQLHPGDEVEIVSDQCSTIFRFVAEGNWDFSTPKKAGVWSVRHRSKFLAVAGAAAVITGLWLLESGWLNYSMLTQQPDPLALELEKWRPFAGNKGMSANAAGESSGSIQAAIADFNSDGTVDLAGLDLNQNLALVDGKEKKASWTLTSFVVDPMIEPVAADLNDNGVPDIVVVTSNGRLVGVDGKIGAEIWTSPYFQMPLLGPPVVADFNGDGTADVAIVEQSGRIQIGFGKIVNIEWATVDLGLEVLAPLSSADLNLDGKDEILCGTERGLVLIVDGVSRKLVGTVDINNELIKARGTGYEDNHIRFPVGVADLNADGSQDLVISTVEGNIVTIDGATKARIWDDRLVEGLTLNTDFPYPFAIGDLTQNGQPDIVVATEQGFVRAYAGNGDGQAARKVLWQYTPTDAGYRTDNLVLADVNKDAFADALFVDQSSVLKIVSGSDGAMLWSTNQPISERTGVPLVGDLESDGLLDVVLASNSGSIYQYKSNAKIPTSKVMWGQRLGQSLNVMRSDFTFPSTSGALLAMVFGGILIFGTGVSLIVSKLRSSRTGK
ncbi:FHA domain-containing protein [candidate division KSB1 bacterium]|nr:FHA domain-containing protein [candidate division KSB1 bacterium]